MPYPTRFNPVRAFLGLLCKLFAKSVSKRLRNGNGQLQVLQPLKRRKKNSTMIPIRLQQLHHHNGLGAVLSHVCTEHPIAYVSRTLSSREIVPKLKKRLQPLSLGYGNSTSTVTGGGSRQSQITSLSCHWHPFLGCCQNVAMVLPTFSLSVRLIFKPTASHCNADGLSRLPQEPAPQTDTPAEVTLFNIGQIHNLPVSTSYVRKYNYATKVTLFLSKVYKFIKRWVA